MDMVKKHPDYNWQMGKEKEYFLKALGELDKRLANKEIRWTFHNQCFVFFKGDKIGKCESDVSRKSDSKSADFGPLVHEAFNCMSSSDNYNSWMKYFV